MNIQYWGIQERQMATALFLGVCFAILTVSFGAVAFFRREDFRLGVFSNRLRSFWREESGASYATSFLMIIPFYVFFFCLTIESTFTIVAKLGTIHAAQSAVRAVALRIAVERPDDRSEWISQEGRRYAKKAACVALTPFSSAVDPDYQQSTDDGVKYYNAYADFIQSAGVDDPVNQKCVIGRYSCAEGRVNVQVEEIESVNRSLPEDEPWRRCVQATVTYKAPYRLPFIGRILGGTKEGNAVVANVQASASAQIECPRNESGFLGIAIPWEVEE